MFQEIKTYKLVIQAKDAGTPSLSSTTTVTLNVADSNTNLPVFKETKVVRMMMIIFIIIFFKFCIILLNMIIQHDVQC